MKVSTLFSLGTVALALVLPAQAADKKFQLKTKPYPMETCVVSGEKLDAMGEGFAFTEGDQEVLLCCESCRKDFNKDKKAQLAKIAEAAKKVKPYPLTTCIVSGEKLDPTKAVGVVHAGREYDFCCKDCVKDFKKNPGKFAQKLEAAT